MTTAGIEPALCRIAADVPAGPGWVYEPKLDGFRLLVDTGPPLRLLSRRTRHLTEYFPEVAAATGAALPPDSCFDGELIATTGNGLSFEALASRLARKRGLAAGVVLFDVLRLNGEDLRRQPLADRRRRLEAAVGASTTVALMPQSDEPAAAAAWLSSPLPGIEGVVAKRASEPYRGGSRSWVKVRRHRTVDCVVAGRRGGMLVLGLYDEAGRLHHIGEAAIAPRLLVGIELEMTSASAFTGRPPGLSRFEEHRYERAEFLPCRPVLVCEVGYTALDGSRFRHIARVERWRPDREPGSCLLGQLRAG